jgi:hypothetical protein
LEGDGSLPQIPTHVAKSATAGPTRRARKYSRRSR